MSLATCIDHGQTTKYATTRRGGVPAYRHRLAYIDKHCLTLADIDGKVVRHKCDNHRCINPEHLELGTQADNLADMWARTRVAPLREHYEAVRSEYVRGSTECGQAALAVKYGMAQSQVGRIVRKELKHDN